MYPMYAPDKMTSIHKNVFVHEIPGPLYQVIFNVGVQYFNIGMQRDVKDEAIWYAKMFVKALQNYELYKDQVTLDSIHERLAKELPHLDLSLEMALEENGESFLDIRYKDVFVNVSATPGESYSLADPDTYYGEGRAETIADADTLIERIKEIFKGT